MASIFDPPPPVVFTRDGRDGFPAEANFEVVMQEYLCSLNPRKREKALMSQAMYDVILIVLTNPTDTRCATPQFRFWTKKMFRLVTTTHAQIVTHENRPVAVKEQIYDVLVQCHHQCSHGGRDKTSNQVRRYYSWIPKELIARFVKACILCNARRVAKSGSKPIGYTALSALGADLSSIFPNMTDHYGQNGHTGHGYDNDSDQQDEASTPSSQFKMSVSSEPSSATKPSSKQYLPLTPGYSGDEYTYSFPNITSEAVSVLPPMPEPSSNPHDWTHWMNNTPQRLALSTNNGTASLVTSNVSPSSKNKPAALGTPSKLRIKVPDHKQFMTVPKDKSFAAFRTPPRSADSLAADDAFVHQVHGDRALSPLSATDFGSIQYPDEFDYSILPNSATSVCFQNPMPTPLTDCSFQPAAIYENAPTFTFEDLSQLLGPGQFVPPVSLQWSTEGFMSSNNSEGFAGNNNTEGFPSNTNSSTLNNVSQRRPYDPGYPGASKVETQEEPVGNTSPASLTTQQPAVVDEDEEERNFQSFMSAIKPVKTEESSDSAPVDPLLRAMNLDNAFGGAFSTGGQFNFDFGMPAQPNPFDAGDVTQASLSDYDGTTQQEASQLSPLPPLPQVVYTEPAATEGDVSADLSYDTSGSLEGYGTGSFLQTNWGLSPTSACSSSSLSSSTSSFSPASSVSSYSACSSAASSASAAIASTQDFTALHPGLKPPCIRRTPPGVLDFSFQFPRRVTSESVSCNDVKGNGTDNAWSGIQMLQHNPLLYGLAQAQTF